MQLGGDGTVLFCSWLFQTNVPPVIPFSLGSLGFLTPFNFDEYKTSLGSAVQNGVRLNMRMRFRATVYVRCPTDPACDSPERSLCKPVPPQGDQVARHGRDYYAQH